MRGSLSYGISSWGVLLGGVIQANLSSVERELAQRVRSQFPVLDQQIGSSRLVYLDNAATTQKPRAVIDAKNDFYEHYNANIHRAPHTLAERATARYEEVRERVRHFIGARDTAEIIFTTGTTGSLNLIARSFGEIGVQAGDEILLTELEHHSNIVPWQMLAQRKGATVLAARVTQSGEIDHGHFRELLSSRTKIVSFAHVSNALGTIHPVEELVRTVREHAPQAVVVIDGAQWVAHGPTDVVALDCDFYVFSAHKLYGPTGVGVLYGRAELLERMPPFLGGGDMIDRVSFSSGTTFAKPPARFEAGTPNIAGVIGLGAAIEFLSSFDWSEIEQSEDALGRYLRERIAQVDKLKVIGSAQKGLAICSFTVSGQSPVDVAVRLNSYGIAVRAGHHCCMPLMESLGLTGTVRASCAIYNCKKDVDALVSALTEIVSKTTEPKQSNQELKLQFGSSGGASVQEAVLQLKTLFDSVDDQLGRQELLMELGETHPNQLPILRNCAPAVKGCLSEVRLVLNRSSDNKLFIASDSNAQIVRGLLTIVERAFSGQSIEEIRSYGPKRIFADLNLPGFVSVQRRSGLESVLNEIVKVLG